MIEVVPDDDQGFPVTVELSPEQVAARREYRIARCVQWAGWCGAQEGVEFVVLRDVLRDAVAQMEADRA